MRFSAVDSFLHQPYAPYTNPEEELIPIFALELKPAFCHVIYNIEAYDDRYITVQAEENRYPTDEVIRTLVTQFLAHYPGTGNVHREDLLDFDGKLYAVTVSDHDASIGVNLLGLTELLNV